MKTTTKRFDPEAHVYYLNDQRVPSVTEILGQVKDLSMVPRETLERKRQLGTALHSCIRLFWTDSLDYDSIDPAVVPYFDAFLDWHDHAVKYDDFELHGYEVQLISERYRYAGTPDIWAAYRGGLMVGDPKTIAGALGPDIGLQLAAYRTLLAEEYGAKWSAAKMYGLQLTPEGRCKPIEFVDPSDWAMFINLLSLHNWKRRHGITS